MDQSPGFAVLPGLRRLGLKVGPAGGRMPSGGTLPRSALGDQEGKIAAGYLDVGTRRPSTVPVVPPIAYEESMTAPSGASPRATRRPRARTTARGRVTSWIVGLSALVLIVVSLGSYLYHRRQLDAIAAGHLRLVVTGPAELQAGAPAEYSVTTTTVTGEPLPAQIELALYSPDGKRLLGEKELGDEKGRVQMIVPADMALPARLPSQAQLKVVATRGQKREEVKTTLAVRPVRYVTRLTLDQPKYRPGETVYYRSLTLSRFGLAADRSLPVQFEVLDPAGAAIAASRHEGITDHGVGNGALPLPKELAEGRYTLVARSLDGAFAEQKHAFLVHREHRPRLQKELEFLRDHYLPADTVTADFLARRANGSPAAGAALRVVATVDGQTAFQRNAQADAAGRLRIEFTLPKKIRQGDGLLTVAVEDGGSQETLSKSIPIHVGEVSVQFYPEGGDLVAGVANRVYFAGHTSRGQPVSITGTIVNSRGVGVASVETVHQGMGSFNLVPDHDETYRLKIASPAGVTDQPKLPPASTEQKVVLSTGTGVFDAGAPLEFNLRASKTGIPLVITAWCRGVPVGQQTLVTSTERDRTSLTPVVIPLDEQIGGVVRLTVYDYSVSPPMPIAERLVYRRMARRLMVRAADHTDAYSPGDKVSLSLSVTNESGTPVAAALGVAVVDEAIAKLVDTPSLTTQFLITAETGTPEDIEEADFYLSEHKDAATALDLFLGTQGWRRLVEKRSRATEAGGQDPKPSARWAPTNAVPPAMFDNLSDLRSKYEENLSEYRTKRTWALNAIITLSLFGGLGLALLITMLGFLKIVSGSRLWLPAFMVIACAAVVLGVVRDPSWHKSVDDAAVAFAPFCVSPADAETAAAGRAAPVESLGATEPSGQEPAEPDEAAPDRPVAVKGAEQTEPARRPDGKDLKQVIQDAAKLDDQSESLKAYRFVVREYAHRHVSGPSDAPTDVATNLCWHPLLIAGSDGRATIRFELPDSVRTLRLLADAHGDGRLGSGTAKILSRLPLHIDPRIPAEVTTGDRIDCPVAASNELRGPLSLDLSLEHDKLVSLEGPSKRKLQLTPRQTRQDCFTLRAVGERGVSKLIFRGTSGAWSESVTRTLRIAALGFPHRLVSSGRIDGPQRFAIPLPAHWVPGSLQVTLNVMPSMLADLQCALEGMAEQRHGSFEHVASLTYAGVLALQTLQEHESADPAVLRRVKDLLKKNATRLLDYECKEKGFEWFGSDPGHEVLAAYGLMILHDMALVGDADPATLQQTTQWLLGRRDQKGGFQRNAAAYRFGGPSEEIANAYIIWALSESGQKGIETEIRHGIDVARQSDDPYLIALTAAAALNARNHDDGRKLLERMAKLQAEDGHVEGKHTSAMSGRGLSLKAETTALAVMAWLKQPGYTSQTQRAVDWLLKNRQGAGTWGSTQATVLALKALAQHTKTGRSSLSEGRLLVIRDDAILGEKTFGTAQEEVISIGGLETKLKPGDNQLSLNLTGGHPMSYTLDIVYHSQEPVVYKDCPLRLTTQLSAKQVKTGGTIALSAELVNTANEGQPMTVAILGLPAGLEPPHEQLEKLKEAGAIDSFRTAPRQVVCCWRSLAPKKRIELRLDLLATVPGQYTSPPSQAYLDYTPEQKFWGNPLTVEITRDSGKP